MLYFVYSCAFFVCEKIAYFCAFFLQFFCNSFLRNCFPFGKFFNVLFVHIFQGKISFVSFSTLATDWSPDEFCLWSSLIVLVRSSMSCLVLVQNLLIDE